MSQVRFLSPLLLPPTCKQVGGFLLPLCAYLQSLDLSLALADVYARVPVEDDRV
ncbi:hypothetical protein [Dictyobacter aurantiacus]|uniref:hypothetical protein n=1 Tax=Dictyobacter aurantiacus TaxID=1936993 RepID=UPI00135BA93B|nr:hypothetical protein [Dictyobacter aurantiacus]